MLLHLLNRFAYIMFKKFIILVITFCYFLSVTGTTIDKFYCCGKLKQTSIFFRLEQKSNCSKKMSMKKGCCLYDESFYKVKDTHQPGYSNEVPIPFVLEIPNNFQDELCITNYTNKVAIIPFSNSPPIILTDEPIFLLNNNFRI